jgi:hypothetical protein
MMMEASNPFEKSETTRSAKRRPIREDVKIFVTAIAGGILVMNHTSA